MNTRAGFAAQASTYFEPLRDAGANVLDSTRQAGALYSWIQDLIKQAREAGEGNPLEGADQVTQRPHQRDQGTGGDSGEGDQTGDGESEGGETDENVNLQVSGKSPKGGKSKALSPEELKKLLEQGAQIDPSQSSGAADGEGMYLTQLSGKQAEELEQMREQLGEIGSMSGHGRLVMSRTKQDSYFAYDEWDYVLADYRRNWCRLREVEVSGDDGDFYNNTLQRYSEMLPVVRRQFQRIRPASFRLVRGLEDGDEIDIDRTIEMRVARLMGEVPDVRVYSARKKEARDVATLFLLDMSASTDEPIHREPRKFNDADDADDDWMKAWQRRPQQSQRPRRIIDVNKEALIIMAQALEEIGDAFAIMGFSGHGRDNVEFYTIKEFDQEMSDEVRCRIGSIEPKRSTRMGAAIRHVREKFKDVSAALQAHDPAERRISAGLRLRPRSPLQRLRHPGHDGRAQGAGARGRAAVLHHGGQDRARLFAPDVPVVALPGDRGHRIAADAVAEGLRAGHSLVARIFPLPHFFAGEVGWRDCRDGCEAGIVTAG